MIDVKGKDWEDVKPGWYKVTIKLTPVDSSTVNKKYTEIINWLDNNIDNWERHCMLTIAPGDDDRDIVIKAKFRYERDYEWFHLTWA